MVLLRRLKERLRRRTAAKTTATKENRFEKEEEGRRSEKNTAAAESETKQQTTPKLVVLGHLRSPSELEEALVESIRDNDATTPHPSLPSSLFADPPLSPPGTQKTNPFVSAPEHARNDSIACRRTCPREMSTKKRMRRRGMRSTAPMTSNLVELFDKDDRKRRHFRLW